MKSTAWILITAAALGLTSASSAHEGAPSEAPATAEAAEERLFAILLAPGPAWKPGLPFQEQGLGPHLAYWVALHREGRLVTAGPLGDDSGLILLYAADQQAAEAMLNGDPAIPAGIFTGTVWPYAPPMVNAARLAAGQD